MRWSDVDIVTSWATGPCRESWCHDQQRRTGRVDSLSHICVQTLPVHHHLQQTDIKLYFSGVMRILCFVTSVEAAWSEAGGWSVTVSESGAWPVPPWGSHSGTDGQSWVPGSGDRWEAESREQCERDRGERQSSVTWGDMTHNVRPWSLS